MSFSLINSSKKWFSGWRNIFRYAIQLKTQCMWYTKRIDFVFVFIHSFIVVLFSSKMANNIEHSMHKTHVLKNKFRFFLYVLILIFIFFFYFPVQMFWTLPIDCIDWIFPCFHFSSKFESAPKTKFQISFCWFFWLFFLFRLNLNI